MSIEGNGLNCKAKSRTLEYDTDGTEEETPGSQHEKRLEQRNSEGEYKKLSAQVAKSHYRLYGVGRWAKG